jgi:hypothetical protein
MEVSGQFHAPITLPSEKILSLRASQNVPEIETKLFSK